MSKTLKILSRPKGNAEEYGRWSVNPYIGCSHGCLYCYLKKGPSGSYLGQNKPVLKKGVVNEEHAFHLAMAEIIENRDEIIRDGGLFMTFTSDPFQRETRTLFLRIAVKSTNHGIPVTILTKCGADCVGRKSMDGYSYSLDCKLEYDLEGLSYRQIAVGWTLTGHDELEPNASPNSERINAMKKFAEDIRGEIVKLANTTNEFLGCKIVADPHIWASIEPVIDFPSSLDMIYQALNAGCQHFKIGLLTNNTRVVRKDFQIGEHQFKAYDVRDLLHFIEDVMRLTDGKATVYWKQSVRDLLGTVYTTAAVDELLNFPHFVGKDWSMFKKED